MKWGNCNRAESEWAWVSGKMPPGITATGSEQSNRQRSEFRLRDETDGLAQMSLTISALENTPVATRSQKPALLERAHRNSHTVIVII